MITTLYMLVYILNPSLTGFGGCIKQYTPTYPIKLKIKQNVKQPEIF